MGFGSKHPPLEFPTVRDLNAGWYVNWNINARPQTPGGMEFVQMVRLHQKTECGSRVSPDRVACPYVYPHDYEYNDIDRAYINRIAANNPGSTYLVGNECDDAIGGAADRTRSCPSFTSLPIMRSITGSRPRIQPPRWPSVV
ncbi:MAG: hypothetical protein HC802_02180 [Caldilineaceae bacterium]|nr:hypothetical protein [Caldilineaceae bacterium]